MVFGNGNQSVKCSGRLTSLIVSSNDIISQLNHEFVLRFHKPVWELVQAVLEMEPVSLAETELPGDELFKLSQPKNQNRQYKLL